MTTKILDLLFPGRGSMRAEVEGAIKVSEHALEKNNKKQEELRATLNGEEYWMLKCLRKKVVEVVKECVEEENVE